MCDVYSEAKLLMQKYEGQVISTIFPEWVRAKRPCENVRPDRCLACGGPMTPEEIWPDGRTPRCMHDTCYQREIVNQINYNCWMTGIPLPKSKIRGQKMFPRELRYNFADGLPWEYFIVCANGVLNTMAAPTSQPNLANNSNYTNDVINISSVPPFSGFLEHKPQMTIDDMLNEMALYRNGQPNRVFETVGLDPKSIQSTDDYNRFCRALYEATHSPGEDYQSWQHEWGKKRKQQVFGEWASEQKELESFVEKIEKYEPHLVEEVYNFDGSYVHTKYRKDGHVYVKMANGHVHQVS